LEEFDVDVVGEVSCWEEEQSEQSEGQGDETTGFDDDN
jgi:hypothetical protein